MFYKGKLNIGVINKELNFANTPQIKKLVEYFNNEFKKNNSILNVLFYISGDYIKNYDNDDNSFDTIMNEVLYNTDCDKILSSIIIDYYIKTNSDIKKIEDLKEEIDDAINDISKSRKIYSAKIKLLSNELYERLPLDVFDEMAFNSPDKLKNYYDGILNEEDIDILKSFNPTLKMKKVEIEEKAFTREELFKRYEAILKNDNVKDEINRIYNISDNKNIQGVNYLFEQDDYDLRSESYKALARALYSSGRLKNPYFNIIQIDCNDNNLKSNFTYLKTRFKISRNDLYFFEIIKGKDIFGEQRREIFYSDCDAFNRERDFLLNILRENQFINIFGIYTDPEVLNFCCEMGSKELSDKFSLVVFSKKLNKEAQIEYAIKKLTRMNQLDVKKSMIDVLEYQNTQTDGLTTSEVDDLIISVLKSKYEKIYRHEYYNVTRDMANGNITKKLMNMVGFKNLKAAVAEMTNKVNFKNLKEDLIPVTKILNQMTNYERNNWILTGVPGTGKSTGAEILEKVMYQEKIITRDIIVKYTPSKTSEDTIFTPFGPMNISASADLHDSFCRSVGGVLIIDEIGHLSNENKSLLLQLMEDYKRDVCVILCGYENEAKELLDSNPGFRSRFTHIINMEEYTVDELLEILNQKLSEKHFFVGEEVNDMLKNIIANVREVPNFGQARFMESISDKLIGIHSSMKLRKIEEMIKTGKYDKIDETEIYEITKEDVEKLPIDDMLGEDYKLVKEHKDAYSELHKLIGCENIKSAIDEYVAKAKIDKIKIDRKLVSSKSFNMNMIFYGSPGTAKTTVARLVSRIMYDKGIMGKPKITEVGASDLVAAYVGQTAIKTKAVFEEAKGGVLFIDEAYSLANSEAGGYNQEAIDTIIKEMENNRKDTLVILAGYKNKMEDLIKCNPGFKSRISKYIEFPNYEISDLIKIFYKLLKDANYRLLETDEKKVTELISKYLEEIINDEQFGNGRECRTILENAINMQSKRLLDIENITDEELMTLKYEDFAYLEKDNSFDKNKKTKIGFAA